MISVAFVAAIQVVQTLADPISEARPATEWQCDFIDSVGGRFQLEGRFPEAPVGWDPNRGLPTQIGGKGPSHFLGAKQVNAFDSLTDARRYQVSYLAADDSRYNLTFQFVRGHDGLSIVTHYVPGQDGKPGTLSAYATGTCPSKFLATGAGAPPK